MASAVSSGAGAERLTAYKAEAMAVLKMGPANLMSRRKLKLLQKQFGLTDGQALDVEREILAEIEREKAEEQRRATEEEARHDAERGTESDLEADDDDGAEEDAPSSGSYSVILKVAAENKGPMLRDLVDMTGKRLWPDISDMVENLPAVVAKGLSHDDAEKYACALMLDGAEAEVVADDACSGDDDDRDDDGDCDSKSSQSSSTETQLPSGRCRILLKNAGGDKIDVVRALRQSLNYDLGTARRFVDYAPVTLDSDMSREDADSIAAALRNAGATVEIVDSET